MTQTPENAAARYCDHCGDERDERNQQGAADAHAACRRLRELEPPRWCGHCRRRMVVQVTPRGWTAKCVEHGVLQG